MNTGNIIDRSKRRLIRISRETKTNLLIVGVSAMTGVVIGMASGLNIGRKISKECGSFTVVNIETPKNIFDELEDDDNNDDDDIKFSDRV